METGQTTLTRRAIRQATVGLAVCGIVAAAIAATTGTSSAGAPSNDQIGSIRAVRAATVALVVPLRAEFGGWCLLVDGQGQCEPQDLTGALVAEHWSAEFDRTATHEAITGVVITRASVRAVSLRNSSTKLATRAQDGLPDRLRAVVVRTVRPRSPRPFWMHLAVPRFVAFNAHGRREAASPGLPETLLVSTQDDEWQQVPVGSSQGVCSIRASSDLAPHDDSVATKAKSLVTPTIGRPLYPCANLEVTFRGTSMLASVLLDAVHPGVTPGNLPGAKRIAGIAGVVSAPGLEGPIVARRIAKGWLAVQGGADTSERLGALQGADGSVNL